MRTTLTLDDDVASRLAELSRTSNRSLKAVVNDALRRGLGSSGAGQPPFVVKPHFGGLRPGIDPGRLNQLAAELEDEDMLGRRRVAENRDRSRS